MVMVFWEAVAVAMRAVPFFAVILKVGDTQYRGSTVPFL